jgi:hypothetical protein
MSDSYLVPLQFHFSRNTEFNDLGFLENWRAKMREYPNAGRVKAAIAALEAMAIRLIHVVISLPRELLAMGAFPKVDRTQDRPESRICISATRDKGTSMCMQTLSNDNYVETFELYIDHEQAMSILEYAHLHANKEFSHPFYMTFLFPVAPNGEKFFCAQYVVLCLQAGGLLQGCNPSAMTGDALLAIMRRFYRVSDKLTPAEKKKIETSQTSPFIYI